MTKGYKSRLALFTDKERAYIDAYGGEPRPRYATSPSENDRQDALSGMSEDDVASRLRTEKTDPLEIAEFIRGFIDDIQRLEKYYLYIEGDRADRYDLIMELRGEDLSFLRNTIEVWESVAEGSHPSMPEDSHKEISQALDPLNDGIRDLKQSNRIEEKSDRFEAILWILRHDEAANTLDLLRFIKETEPRIQQGSARSTLRENTVGNSEWIKWGPRWLGYEYGLIEEHPRSRSKKAYQLTERGEAVLESIENVVETNVVAERTEEHGESAYEAAAILIGS